MVKRNKKLSLELFENAPAVQTMEKNGGSERKKMLRALKKAVKGELTRRQTECLLLYYGGKISEKEIAAQLGITPPTVSKHLKKARLHLQRVMKYYFLP